MNKVPLQDVQDPPKTGGTVGAALLSEWYSFSKLLNMDEAIVQN
jgi:hypothetical protein